MRLARLAFARVGLWRQPFELALGSRVTLVLGDNEAGKSTLRRAIDALLFGPDKERVAPRDVGGFEFAADVDIDSGTRFRLSRRGNKLVAPPPEVLKPLLAPTQAGRFRDLFCLSHENLRADDRAFLGANGAIGSLMFGASAGISPARLSQTLDRLDKQIRKAWSSAKNEDGLGTRLGAYDAQRQRHLDVARFEQYQQALERVEIARAEEERWTQRGRELREEHARLRQLLDGFDACEALRSARHEWLRLQSTHQPVPLAQATALHQLWEQLAQADLDLAGRHQELDQAQQALEALPLASPLHALADEADALRDAVAHVDADRRELVADSEASTAHVRELRRLLESLGAGAGPDPVAAAGALLRPAPIRNLLQLLVDRHESIASRKSVHESALADATRRLRLAADRAAQAPRVDLQPIERARAFAETAVKQEQALAELARALRKLEGDSEDLARQLGFAQSSDVDRLCPVAPDRRRAAELESTLARQRAEHEASQAALEAARRLQQTRRTECAALQLRLGEMPSAERIAQSRSLRDAKWRELQGLWTPRIQPGAEAALARSAAEFEALMALVDAELGLRASAGELLGQWQSAESALAAADRTLDEAGAALESGARACADSQGAWSAMWSFLDAPPASAAVWFAHHDNWLALARRGRELRADIEAARTALAASKGAALAQAGAPLAGLAQASSSGAILDEIRREERARIEANQRAGILEGAVQQAGDALQQAQDRLERSEAEEADWRREWELRCASLPAGIAPIPGEVRAWLAGQSGLERVRKDAEELAARIEARRERVHGLDQRIAALVERARELDAELVIAPTLDARHAFDALLAATQRASERQRARQATLETLANARRELDRVQAQRKRLADSLDALWAQLGLRTEPGAAAVEEVLDIAQRAARLQKEIDTEDARLDGLWREQRAAFEARLGNQGRNALESTLQAIAAEVADVAATIREKAEARHEAGSALRRLDDSHDLLAVQQAYTEAREAVLDKADELHRLLLARYLLQQAYEQASNRANQLEERASGYFALLTAQSCSGLRIDRDQNSGGTLKAIASHGGEKSLDELSAGTRDQIWLALRLAAVVEAAHETPFPLLLDDIFVHFDDERSSAALRLLAEVSRHVQVIAFTHHEHIAALAQAAIPSDQLALIALPRPDAGVHAPLLARERGRRARVASPEAGAAGAPEAASADLFPGPPDAGRPASAESAERTVLDVLGAAASAQSKSEILAAARNRGVDLEAAWSTAINHLLRTQRIRRDGEKKWARYSLLQG